MTCLHVKNKMLTILQSSSSTNHRLQFSEQNIMSYIQQQQANQLRQICPFPLTTTVTVNTEAKAGGVPQPMISLQLNSIDDSHFTIPRRREAPRPTWHKITKRDMWRGHFKLYVIQKLNASKQNSRVYTWFAIVFDIVIRCKICNTCHRQSLA